MDRWIANDQESNNKFELMDTMPGIKEIVFITSTARKIVRKYVALYKNLGIPIDSFWHMKTRH